MKRQLITFLASIIAILGLASIPDAEAGDVSSIHALWDTTGVSDSAIIKVQIENLKSLQVNLLSSKPTIGFFYYSVACSCAAAKCNLAAAAIDSIPELDGKNDSLHFTKIDAYLVPEAESLFNIMVIPAIVYFDKDGKEINRLEWGTNRDAIKMLIDHPEIKQPPLD